MPSVDHVANVIGLRPTDKSPESVDGVVSDTYQTREGVPVFLAPSATKYGGNAPAMFLIVGYDTIHSDGIPAGAHLVLGDLSSDKLAEIWRSHDLPVNCGSAYYEARFPSNSERKDGFPEPDLELVRGDLARVHTAINEYRNWIREASLGACDATELFDRTRRSVSDSFTWFVMGNIRDHYEGSTPKHASR